MYAIYAHFPCHAMPLPGEENKHKRFLFLLAYTTTTSDHDVDDIIIVCVVAFIYSKEASL